MSQKVTILGGGIIGICCALSLAQRGISVRMIDRNTPGQGATSGNAGIISPWSIVPMALPGLWKKLPGMLLDKQQPLKVHPRFWPQMLPWGLKFMNQSDEASVRRISESMQYLCSPSIELYRKHLAGTGNEGLVKDSLYVHAFRSADKPSLKSLDYRIRQEKGADLTLIGTDDLHQLEPALSRDFKAAVLIKGQARAVSPGDIAASLAQKASDLGVEILRFETSSLQHNGSEWVLKGAEASIHCETLVLAAGIWSGELLKSIGVSLPMVAERGYHVEYTNPGIEVNNSIMDVDAKVVASSMSGGMRLAGAAEFSWADAPPDLHRKPLMDTQAKAMFPELRDSEPKFWMGHRPSLPDSLPVLGRVPGHEGLFAAFGHSHYGLMMAPKTGEVIAELISGTVSDINLSAFSPERFR